MNYGALYMLICLIIYLDIGKNIPFSPNGELIALGCYSNSFKFIDAKHKKLLRRIRQQNDDGFNLLIISYFSDLDDI